MRLLLCCAAMMGSALAHAQSCSFAPVETRFSELLSAQSLSGGALLIASQRGVLMERYLGDYSAATRIPIASASKILSGLRLLQLRDRGALDLDAPLSSYLPAFTGARGAMTVRQMFAHTSGYGGDSGSPIVFNRNITLAQAVATIASSYPLQNGWLPGAQFAYGGISMHIAGRIAEVRGNGDWQAQWQSEIGAPLGISTIDWQGFGATQNYGIAGSAQSNLRDYGQILQMMANRGVGNGRRILSAARIEEMMLDQVGALPIGSAPANAPDPLHYGFGGWLEYPVLGEKPLMHSLGAFGYFPWIDFERNIFGVFMIRGTGGINAQSLPAYTAMLSSVRTAVDGGGCVEGELFDRVFTDRF